MGIVTPTAMAFVWLVLAMAPLEVSVLDSFDDDDDDDIEAASVCADAKVAEVDDGISVAR
jgi:hypothetical protein